MCEHPACTLFLGCQYEQSDADGNRGEHFNCVNVSAPVSNLGHDTICGRKPEDDFIQHPGAKRTNDAHDNEEKDPEQDGL